MRKNLTISLILFFFINSFTYFEAKSKINTKIIVKVGNKIITSIDIQNEIVTSLLLKKLVLTQENINNSKNYAIKNLINKNIKEIEINKYEVQEYNEVDLKNYIINVAEIFNTNTAGLKQVFKSAGVSYDVFIEKYKTELIWNTLIYQKYKNQININAIEVETEIEKLRKDNNEITIKKIKKEILQKKKTEKLSLFSRSHFSNLENSISINFQ